MSGPVARRVPIADTRELRRAVLRPYDTPEEIVAHERPGMQAVGGFIDDALVGCGLVTPGPEPTGWRVRGMATHPDHRGRGVGGAVLAELLRIAADGGARRVWCNARTPALSLYTRAGFRVVSDEFELPGIGPHHVVERRAGLGVLSLGDSISNGGGELQSGVAMKSWAEWLARGLGLPYSGFATDGAQINQITDEQIPRVLARPDLGLRYDLGTCWIGTNDVRNPEWDPARFTAGFDTAMAFLGERCERRLTCTVPLDLGRPRAGRDRVAALNAIIRERAAAHKTTVVELADFSGRNLLMTDHVHLTAFGQVWLAEQALDALGLPVIARPTSMIFPGTSYGHRLRRDWTYAYRHLKVSARAAATLLRNPRQM